MTYALLANPHKNFYPTRNKKVNLIVLHVTAGLQDLDQVGADQSAAGTNRYGATTATQASWHKCVDSDSIDDALPDEYTAWHCVSYNSPSLGLEISNADARWDNKPDGWIYSTLLNAARVCLTWEKKFGIPRRLLNKVQVDAGMSGYSYHMFLDPARRHDPGATFPWDRFVQILQGLETGNTDPLPPTSTTLPVSHPVTTPGSPAPAFPLPSGWYFGPKSGPKESVSGYYSHQSDLKAWQQQMSNRGWNITVDGLYGDQTEKIARDFQTEKGLAVDGKIGPVTWAAAWTAPITRNV